MPLKPSELAKTAIVFSVNIDDDRIIEPTNTFDENGDVLDSTIFHSLDDFENFVFQDDDNEDEKSIAVIRTLLV